MFQQVNPLGIRVAALKAPTPTGLEHDFQVPYIHKQISKAQITKMLSHSTGRTPKKLG